MNALQQFVQGVIHFLIVSYSYMSKEMVIVIVLNTVTSITSGFMLGTALRMRKVFKFFGFLCVLISLASSLLGYSSAFWAGFNYAADHNVHTVSYRP